MPILVNGETIEDAVVRQEASAMRPRYEEMMAGMDPVEREMQLRDWSRENVIERVLLRQAAVADPEPVPAEAVEQMVERARAQSSGQPGCAIDEDEIRREAETQLKVERLVARITTKVSPPRQKDLTEYYRKHQEQFWSPETIRAAHIVKHVNGAGEEEAALAVLRDVKAQLDAGGDFAALADQFSDCPGKGGDLGYFPRGEMVEEFEKAVFELDVNQTSDIFRSPFGFHIARLLDRRPAGHRPLNDVREEVEAAVLQAKRDKVFEQYLDKLRAGAKVEIIKAKT
ncbi:MAG: peptidylprolyl isomerase [Bryobacterales bacterium]|nr:peptidylprolyl isomerase [Bryobacterales bacterium]